MTHLRGPLVLAVAFVSAAALTATEHPLAQSASGQVVFRDVKVRFSQGSDRLMVEKGASVVVDDATRRLVVRSNDRPLSAPYDAVRKIVMESNLRGTDISWAAMFVGPLALAGRKELAESVCVYIESAGSAPVLLLAGKESMPGLRDRLLATFTARVIEPRFSEDPESIEKSTLPEVNVKYDVRADKARHPLPELKSAEALIVVACPPINTSYAGLTDNTLYVDDRIVAANEMGSYTFFYVSPGEHCLVSCAKGNASAIRMGFEAGKDYYFLQNTYLGKSSPLTLLTRQSKELVMYEVEGSYWAAWTKK